MIFMHPNQAMQSSNQIYRSFNCAKSGSKYVHMADSYAALVVLESQMFVASWISTQQDFLITRTMQS